MSRVICLIDGFNLYHAIKDDNLFKKYKWLDLKKLAQGFLTSKETLAEVLYFTAYAVHRSESFERHKIYIKALDSVGVKIILGEFKKRDRFCPSCHKNTSFYQEKQTDVNIAIELLRLAVMDKYDKALIISGDSDLIPSIEAVKRTFPNKMITVVVPVGRRAEQLRSVAHQSMKMKGFHLESAQFPESLNFGSEQIQKPKSWKIESQKS